MAEQSFLGVSRPSRCLVEAIRRLEEALDQDRHEFTEKVQAFNNRFHDYSALNRFLIFLQKEDATFVKGRNQWTMEGRQVKDGVEAIRILAPVFSSGIVKSVIRYKEVMVYDISDTYGRPLEVPMLTPEPGQDERVRNLLKKLEEWVIGSGLELYYQAYSVNRLIYGATNGQVIWVHPHFPPEEKLIVLAHEIAHVKLHFGKNRQSGELQIDEQGQERSRTTRELQAELTAFLILALSGIDCAPDSAVYLNCWDADRAQIREHVEQTFVVACSVLNECERKKYKTFGQSDPSKCNRDVFDALCGNQTENDTQ